MALAVTERLAGRWFVFIADSAIAVDDICAVNIEDGSAGHTLAVHLRSGRTVVPVTFRGSWRSGDARDAAVGALDEVLLALAEIPEPEAGHVGEPTELEDAPAREMLALPTGPLRPTRAAVWLDRLRWRQRR